MVTSIISLSGDGKLRQEPIWVPISYVGIFNRARGNIIKYEAQYLTLKDVEDRIASEDIQFFHRGIHLLPRRW